MNEEIGTLNFSDDDDEQFQGTVPQKEHPHFTPHTPHTQHTSHSHHLPQHPPPQQHIPPSADLMDIFNDNQNNSQSQMNQSAHNIISGLDDLNFNFDQQPPKSDNGGFGDLQSTPLS
jgi:hypothetical protein